MKKVLCDHCGADDTRVKYKIRASSYKPHCFNARSQVGVPPRDFEIVKCNKCGLMYTNPRLDGKELMDLYPPELYTTRKGYLYLWNLFGKGYSKEGQKKVRKKKNDLCLTRLMKYYKKEGAEKLGKLENGGKPESMGKLIDIGCGNGQFLELAKESGWETFGIETAETAAKNAEKSGAKIFHGELHKAAYPSGYFDVVTIIGVIEHVPSPAAVMEEAYRILKPKGILLLTTMDTGALNARIGGKRWISISPAIHIYYFTKKTLHRLIEKPGFEILESYMINSSPTHFINYLISGASSIILSLLASLYCSKSKIMGLIRAALQKARILPPDKEVLEKFKLMNPPSYPRFRDMRAVIAIKE